MANGSPGAESGRAIARSPSRFTLQVRRVRQTYLISISYSSSDPATPALVANAFAQAYLDEELDAKRQAIQRAEDLLDSRVADLKQRVQDAETAVGDYRLRTRAPWISSARAKRMSGCAPSKGTLMPPEHSLRRSWQDPRKSANRRTCSCQKSRIVQVATMPKLPSGPNRLLLGPAGFLVSIGFGVGVACLLEGIDRTVRSGDQASSALGSRLFSSVPTIGSGLFAWKLLFLPRRRTSVRRESRSLEPAPNWLGHPSRLFRNRYVISGSDSRRH